MIPIEGELQTIPAPINTSGVSRILSIPRGAHPQSVRDSDGARWWFWRRGTRNSGKKNPRANQWLGDRGFRITIDGPVLYTSLEEDLLMNAPRKA